jgi:hypothetical protein
VGAEPKAPCSLDLSLSGCHEPPQQQDDLLFWARNLPSQGYGAAGYLLAALAAATILSKRLSPRKESQHGLKRS